MVHQDTANPITWHSVIWRKQFNLLRMGGPKGKTRGETFFWRVSTTEHKVTTWYPRIVQQPNTINRVLRITDRPALLLLQLQLFLAIARTACKLNSHMQVLHGTPSKNSLNNGHSFCGLGPDHIESFLGLSWAYIITFTILLAIAKLRQCSKALRVIPVLLLMARISFPYARRLGFVKPTFGTRQIICVHYGSDAIKRNLYSCGLLTISLPCTSLPRLLLRLNWLTVRLWAYIAATCTSLKAKAPFR